MATIDNFDDDKPKPLKPRKQAPMPVDLNRAIVEKLVLWWLSDMDAEDKRTPSLFEVGRKLLSDNSVTLASVRRGDFGKVAQEAAEEFPFDDQGRPIAAPAVSH